MSALSGASVLVTLLLSSATAFAQEAPPSIDQLRSNTYADTVQFARKLEAGPGYSAYLVSYRSSGLKVYAMVAIPLKVPPPSGFPVLIANHGFEPDPARYGFTEAGVDSRPGDYYRQIPSLYTSRGFLVVMPDYRGHNHSEGREFARAGFSSSSYYTADVLALLGGLASIEHADTHNVFMWGHSLGGEVTLRALLATNRIRGASLWSSVGGTVWQQAYYYSRVEHPLLPDSDKTAKSEIEKLRREIAAAGPGYDWRQRDPRLQLRYLHTPIIMHHSIDDHEASYYWSADLAELLYFGGHRYVFYSYPGADHLLTGVRMQEAADRDAEFFRGLLRASRGAR